MALLTDYITAHQKKPHHSLVLQEHPNSGTFAANILQEIIHFYVIIYLENIAKHDRNENHVKETKGMYSVSSNTIRSEQRDAGWHIYVDNKN